MLYAHGSSCASLQKYTTHRQTDPFRKYAWKPHPRCCDLSASVVHYFKNGHTGHNRHRHTATAFVFVLYSSGSVRDSKARRKNALVKHHAQIRGFQKAMRFSKRLPTDPTEDRNAFKHMLETSPFYLLSEGNECIDPSPTTTFAVPVPECGFSQLLILWCSP